MEDDQNPTQSQIQPTESTTTLESVVVQPEGSPVPPEETLAPTSTPQTEPEKIIPQPVEPIVTQSTVTSTVEPKTSRLRQLLDKAFLALDFRKQKRLEKIMTFAQKKGSVSNDEVEKLLHVSNATASRYLSTLARQGKLNRVGRGSLIRFQVT